MAGPLDFRQSGATRVSGDVPGETACPACRRPSPSGAKFCAECGAKLQPDAPDKRATPAPRSRAERRQVTVMFCDLVASTLLASRLDPEDLLEVTRSYQSCVTTTVQRFGGFVVRYIGDGVLVYFGWPQADETNAERAVRAGLAVIDSVGRMTAKEQTLRVRIGIASSVLVVGGSAAPGAAPEQPDAGEALNLSAGLQGLAEPNTVVIDQVTRTQIGGLFDCEDLALLVVKGYAEPVRAWRVLGESAVESRFEALHAAKLSRVVGREEEIELLLRRWHQIKQGEGRIVLIAGDPGIGKSRLIAELEERLPGGTYTRLRYFCAPHHQDSALHPIIGHFERAAGFARGDSAADKARKLRAALAQANPPEEDMALFAHMLSLPGDGNPVLNLSPQRRKEKTFDALNRQIERLARKRPVVMIIEDVHWADPTTLELLDISIDHVQHLPVLLFMTYRPEFRPRWAGRAGINLIMLSRLERPQSEALVAQLASGDPLPDGLIQRIVTESDGVPLFIEELTKAVLESKASRELDDGTLAPLSVPTTLQASLMSRLDRLPAAKEVAQIGAVVGRQFSYGLLAGVAQMPEPALLQGLDQLMSSEIVSRRGTPPDAWYTFKHALVQDTAYESLLRSRRSALHARVVEVLVDRTPEVEETQPGLLGHHCAQAGLIEKAALYYRRAGERSAERAALAETREQLERGLSLISSLPDSTGRRVLEVELKLALGRILFSMRGNADVDAGRVFEEAVLLCRDLDRIELFTRALWGYWFNRAHSRELLVAENAAQELLGLGERQDDMPARIVAHGMLGITRFWQGNIDQARMDLQTATELARTGAHRRLDLAIVSDNFDSHVSMQLSLTLACLGHLDVAATQAARTMERALTLPHLPSRAILLGVKCRHDWFVRDYGALRETASALVALAEEQAFPFYLAIGRCHLGWLAAKDGQIEEGLNLLQAGLAVLRSSDATIWEPYFRGVMAEAEAFAGNTDEARRLLDEAIALSTQTGAAWFEAELYRGKGEVLLMGPVPDRQEAEALFQRAIEIAQSQSAKLWELRAATSLAQLWADQGERAKARALLAPIHAWFVPAADTADVRRAAALLAELTSPSHHDAIPDTAAR